MAIFSILLTALFAATVTTTPLAAPAPSPAVRPLPAAPTPAHAPAIAAPPPDPLAALEVRQQVLFERTAPSVVFIANPDGFGSGVFVSPEGLILTNAHVVRGQSKVEVVTHDGRRLSGLVLERALDDIDLALVQVTVQNAPVLPLDGYAELRVGSWVAAVGHGRGAIWTFNTGMVSNIYPDGSEHPVFQTQIPLNPGNSGGPIIDRLGRVVGIVTAGIEGSNSINFGIGIDVARRSLPRLTAICDCLAITAPKGVPIFVDGAMAGTGPRVVMPALARTYDVFAVIGGRMSRQQVTFPTQRAIELK